MWDSKWSKTGPLCLWAGADAALPSARPSARDDVRMAAVCHARDGPLVGEQRRRREVESRYFGVFAVEDDRTISSFWPLPRSPALAPSSPHH